MKNEIIESIQKATKLTQIDLEVPENSQYGDYSTNVALQLSKKENKKPRDLAEELVSKLNNSSNLVKIVDKIEIAGPGFINFFLKKETLIDILLSISSQKFTDRYRQQNKGKSVIIEYSSPNIAKPFTIGHLRSTIIGDAISNLLEATGWKVYRDNHLGDWGTQFGKQIYAIKTWGDLAQIEKSDNPVRVLVDLYVRFHEEAEKNPSIEDNAREWFKKLEDGDPEARTLWQKCVDLSWVEFSKIYEKLGVTFNKEFNGGRGLGEAFFEDKMGSVISELEKSKLLKTGKEGARLVFFDGEKYPPAMIIKKDGATLYHTRDLATDKYRKEKYKPDLIINEVGMEQSLYFQQLYEMERLLNWFNEGQRVHIAHGLYRFKEKKMSTRKGEVIWLTEVLEEAVKRARDLGSEDSETAEMVAIGALKYNDLKRDPKGDIVFDWDEILNMEGNSGPYLQYTYARCRSVLTKSGFSKVDDQYDRDFKVEEPELTLLRLFVHYSEVIAEASEKYAPNMVCNYLYTVAQRYNSFYNSSKIIGGEAERLRLLITSVTSEILRNGLGVLGIQVPEKM